jgi:hypothetical protein
MEAALWPGLSGPAVLAHLALRSSSEEGSELSAFVGRRTSCRAVVEPPGSVLSGAVPAGQQRPRQVRSADRFRSASCRRNPFEREARTRLRARRPQGSQKSQPGRSLATGNVHLVSGNAACWSSREVDRFTPSGNVPVGRHDSPDPPVTARRLPDTGVLVTAPRGSSGCQRKLASPGTRLRGFPDHRQLRGALRKERRTATPGSPWLRIPRFGDCSSGFRPSESAGEGQSVNGKRAQGAERRTAPREEWALEGTTPRAPPARNKAGTVQGGVEGAGRWETRRAGKPGEVTPVRLAALFLKCRRGTNPKRGAKPSEDG